ncbi:MAG: hypothetical protein JNK82_16040 [Myxococcaceae bacterium]|nr:hypothetical protein [Myxococcaceae bacterium]
MGIGKVMQQAATRIGNQRERISEGVKNGDLTPREQKRLDKKLDKLTAQLAKDAFDGKGLTEREQAKFDRKADKLSGKIYKNKHDGQNAQTPKGDRRADRLEQRIAKGVETGALNEREAARLGAKHDAFEAALADAKSDGKVTKSERKELRAQANDLSFRVLLQKND